MRNALLPNPARRRLLVLVLVLVLVLDYLPPPPPQAANVAANKTLTIYTFFFMLETPKIKLNFHNNIARSKSDFMQQIKSYHYLKYRKVSLVSFF